MTTLGLIQSSRPLFTKYTFVLDLTKTEEELLQQMHPKTRYNIKVAQKHGVLVKEEFSDNAFADYVQLTQETTSRQGFYAHTPQYHRKMWETLGNQISNSKIRNTKYEIRDTTALSAHLLIARYKNIPLTTWILFTFKDTLYYPYGASSSRNRETMSSNLQMWEAILFGKKLGLKKFDMWGSLGENPDTRDPWYGFHKFKMGYGPTLVEFVGSYDLVINPLLYVLYVVADKTRWLLLKLKK
jgi:lipid II:glycine glycyltransferase (peptidoglycan interpeptide bridge formation enzyme)